MISCIQNIVFNMLHLPFGLAEYIEYLISNLFKIQTTSGSQNNLLSVQECFWLTETPSKGAALGRFVRGARNRVRDTADFTDVTVHRFWPF